MCTTETNDPAHPGRHDDGWRMLHPAALIMGIAGSVKSAIGVLLAVVGYRIIRSGWSDWIFAGAVVLALALFVVPAVTEWLTTRYRLGADALELRTGLFSRKHRTIGYGAIHTIDSASPMYLQPFGVTRLTITAAGSDANITLDAVPVALQLELESLRAASASAPASAAQSPASAAPAATASPSAASASQTPASRKPTDNDIPARDGIPRISAFSDRPVFRASVRDIILFAVTNIGALTAALAMYAFFDQIRDLIPRDWMRSATRSVDAIVARGALSIALFAAACVVVVMAVSVVAAMLQFYGFEVWRRGDDLVIVRGLFTRRTSTLPVSRIQTIVIRQSLLRRPFRLCSVSLGLSASANSGDDDASGSDASDILPVVGTRRVIAILRAMLPEWDVRDDLPMRRTGRGLTRYYVTLPIACGLLAVAVTVGVMLTYGWMGRWWAWPVTAIVALAAALWTVCGWLCAQVEGYALPGDETAASADGVADGRAQTSVSRSPLPHRIMATGMHGLTRYMMVTRRSRVQSVSRTSALWREPRGIETLRMPLFVTNDIDELRFRFLRTADADRLAAWAEM